MKQNDYQILLNEELKKAYKGTTAKVLSYIIYRHNGFSQYRTTHNGWFGIGDDDFKNDLNITTPTVRLHITRLMMDGLIEKKTGRKGMKNQYRLSIERFENTFNYSFITIESPIESIESFDVKSTENQQHFQLDIDIDREIDINENENVCIDNKSTLYNEVRENKHTDMINGLKFVIEELRAEVVNLHTSIDELKSEVEELKKQHNTPSVEVTQHTNNAHTIINDDNKSQWEDMKKRRVAMWDKFNKWICNIHTKDEQTINEELQKYINYIPSCCDGKYIEQTKERMCEQVERRMHTKGTNTPSNVTIPNDAYIDAATPKALYIQQAYSNILHHPMMKGNPAAFAMAYLTIWESKNNEYINTGDWNKMCSKIQMKLTENNEPLFEVVN